MKIKVAVLGYGNLGKGIEKEIINFPDMELVRIFTRETEEELENYINKLDVLFLCVGSATDLPKAINRWGKLFNTVDSYDNHKNMEAHLSMVKKIAETHKKTIITATGWDPGLFSIMRVLFESVLPKAKAYTFWGKGISQGHSQAIRNIEGVVDAVQYTIPKRQAVVEVKRGLQKQFSKFETHKRVCYVVVDVGDPKEQIEKEIKQIPNYFEGSDVEVNFITQKELDKKHKKLSQKGLVFIKNKNVGSAEFKLDLKSNPRFTASVMLAYARACHKMHEQKQFGVYTVFDIPIGLLVKKPSVDKL
ncbi:MAG: diaminopimelate dehydrogenase [Firmicutes bacterium]|nr:diaminopimelate dehydrogenase [Bacillota bacterium]